MITQLNVSFYQLYFKCSCPEETTENLREAHRNKRDYIYNIEKAECLKRKYTERGAPLKVEELNHFIKNEKKRYKNVYKHEYTYEMQPCERRLFLQHEDKWNGMK